MACSVQTRLCGRSVGGDKVALRRPAFGLHARPQRYIEFHPSLAVAYVVNELGCNVSVFTFDQMAVRENGWCGWMRCSLW